VSSRAIPVARDPELVGAPSYLEAGSCPLLEDAGPLGSPELAQPGLRLRFLRAYARYGLLEILLAAAKFCGLRSLFLQGVLVVALFWEIWREVFCNMSSDSR
jgi:hypothetical protein